MPFFLALAPDMVSPNPQELPLSVITKHRKSDKVHYISLKPLSKKERRRQKRLASAGSSFFHDAEDSNGGAYDDDVDDEAFLPRSPVHLPDASTCKPILVQLGFELTQKTKKGRKLNQQIAPNRSSPAVLRCA